ncbi:hypothetical protein imdm_1514 [gamma proteobacterium IMCC2047]|nr:hypothetical protein imdm_1514 [gamma proteobacterium IMCC2047]
MTNQYDSHRAVCDVDATYHNRIDVCTFYALNSNPHDDN